MIEGTEDFDLGLIREASILISTVEPKIKPIRGGPPFCFYVWVPSKFPRTAKGKSRRILKKWNKKAMDSVWRYLGL